MDRRILWLVAALCAAEPAMPAGAEPPVVVRAQFDDADAARRVAATFGHARIDFGRGVLQVDTDADGIARLRDAGFEVEVDVEATARLERGLAMFTPAVRSIPGHACYRTVEETFATLDALAVSRPDLVSILDVGESWEAENGPGGYPIRVARLTNTALPGPKPVLMLVASIHAREYTPAELATRFVEGLVQEYGTDADATWILDHHEIHAVLQANPDGRKIAEAGDLWRKNRNNDQCGGGNFGVDLNRNFPYEWGNWGGSSGNACDETYRGVASSSEPEVWAIADHARNAFPDQRGDSPDAPAPSDASGVFIDLHSYSQLVLWPWGYDDALAPNGTALAALGRRLAWFNGYTAQQAVGLYPTDGATDDFAYGELGVAAFTMELGTSFFQACGTFENTILPDNLAALRYAARVARAPYLLPSGPEAVELSAAGGLVAAGQPFTVRVRLDDSRFQQGLADNSGPPAPVHLVSGANLFVGTPPWQATDPSGSMTAEDGALDSSNEVLVGSLDGLAPGRHMVFVQGRDASGADGPVAATFVEAAPGDEIAVLAGTVTSRSDAAPLAATVTSGSLVSHTDPNDGAYVRALPPGTHDLLVQAPHHEPALVEGFVAAAGAATQRDFPLYALCPLLDEPVDQGVPSAFTPDPPWTVRAGQGHDGGAAWVSATGGSYGNGLNVSLTSAVMDFTGWNSPALGFHSRCDTESGWDFGIVEVSTGGAWSEVYRCHGQPQWRHVYLDLPQLAGAASARIRFRLTTDSNTTAPGWFVDDVLLESSSQACRDQQAPPQVAIASFTASPASILLGDSAQLAWQTENADACTLDDGGDALALAPGELDSGTRDVTPATDTVYVLSCDGVAGPVQADTTVTVQTPVSIDGFAATPDAITSGETSTLEWTTSAAAACTLEGDGETVELAVAELAEGSRVVAPEADASYTLRCNGAGPPQQASAAVIVAQPVQVLAFDAWPANVVRGDPVTVAWQTQHAEGCTLQEGADAEPEPLGAASDIGLVQRTPLISTVYVLDCAGPGGPVGASATVTVQQPPAPVFANGFE